MSPSFIFMFSDELYFRLLELLLYIILIRTCDWVQSTNMLSWNCWKYVTTISLNILIFFIHFLAAAFFFHACLLLVLFRWRPSKDDSALFYVIAAAWGACNGIWETLLFALMSLTHTNHIMKIASPLQSCRFLGLGITFLLHTFICEYHKILILVVLLVICLPPYAVLEVRLEAQRKSQSTSMWRNVFS